MTPKTACEGAAPTKISRSDPETKAHTSLLSLQAAIMPKSDGSSRCPPIPGGYFHIVSTSNRLFFAFRSIVAPGKTEKDAIAYVKKLRVYDLDQASNPPEQKYIDILKTRIPALPYYDERAFKDIYDVINAEPVREQDKVMMGMLKTLGIEKKQTLQSRRRNAESDAAGYN